MSRKKKTKKKQEGICLKEQKERKKTESDEMKIAKNKKNKSKAEVKMKVPCFSVSKNQNQCVRNFTVVCIFFTVVSIFLL